MHSEPLHPSRRSFIQTAAVIAGAIGAQRLGLAADQPATDEYGGLAIGLQSYTLRSMSFDKALEAMKDELKLHNVEIFPNHLAGISPPQALEKLKAADVKAMSFGVIPFTKNHDGNRKRFEFAKTMGMTNLSCDPDPNAFDSLDKLTEEYKITAAIHDHGPGHRWGKIDVIAEAIKNHSKMIGLCNDTGHFIRAGEDPLRACEVFKDRIYAVHLKDFTLNKGNFEDCVAGNGGLDVPALVKWLVTSKFKGGVFIEYEGHDPVNASQQSLARVKEALSKA